MRRLTGIAVAVAFCAAVFGVPAIIAKDLVQRPVAEANFRAVFNYVLRLAPGLRLDRSSPVDRSLDAGGGSRAPIRCLRITQGSRGWLCASLSSDGERFAAAWVAPTPTARPPRLLLADDDNTTPPNP